jgi:hypothetical protein
VRRRRRGEPASSVAPSDEGRATHELGEVDLEDLRELGQDQPVVGSRRAAVLDTADPGQLARFKEADPAISTPPVHFLAAS